MGRTPPSRRPLPLPIRSWHRFINEEAAEQLCGRFFDKDPPQRAYRFPDFHRPGLPEHLLDLRDPEGSADTVAQLAARGVREARKARPDLQAHHAAPGENSIDEVLAGLARGLEERIGCKRDKGLDRADYDTRQAWRSAVGRVLGRWGRETAEGPERRALEVLLVMQDPGAWIDEAGPRARLQQVILRHRPWLKVMIAARCAAPLAEKEIERRHFILRQGHITKRIRKYGERVAGHAARLARMISADIALEGFAPWKDYSGNAYHPYWHTEIRVDYPTSDVSRMRGDPWQRTLVDWDAQRMLLGLAHLALPQNTGWPKPSSAGLATTGLRTFEAMNVNSAKNLSKHLMLP